MQTDSRGEFGGLGIEIGMEAAATIAKFLFSTNSAELRGDFFCGIEKLQGRV